MDRGLGFSKMLEYGVGNRLLGNLLFLRRKEMLFAVSC